MALSHVEWWENLMKENGRCAACEQEDYYRSPDACMDGCPSIYEHNPDSPKCRKKK